MRLSIFAFVGFLTLLVGCQQNNPQIPAKNVQQKDSAISTKDSVDSSSSIVPSDTVKQLSFNNPIMFPTGTSLVNLLKAYYNTGQFQKMKPFLIVKNNSKKPFETSIETIDWAYKITLKNCEWITKKKFKLTYTSTINNTPHLEQYYGEIVNDTAKLYYNCLFENPFKKQ